MKYTEIEIGTEVNVSSSYDYTFTVYMKGGPPRDYAPYRGFAGVLPYRYGWNGAPKYLIKEVNRLIAKGCREGTFKFFEYNRDGIKRFENLRYHDPETVKRWGETLDKESDK